MSLCSRFRIVFSLKFQEYLFSLSFALLFNHPWILKTVFSFIYQMVNQSSFKTCVMNPNSKAKVNEMKNNRKNVNDHELIFIPK